MRTPPSPPLSRRRSTQRVESAGAPRLVRLGLSVLLLAATAVVVPLTHASAAAVVSDSFKRSAASGWGAADTGGAWAKPTGQATASVSQGVGRLNGLTPGRDTRVALVGPAVLDVVLHASVIVPNEMPFYYSVEGRRQPDGSAYRGRIVMNPSSVLLQVLRVDSHGGLMTVRQVNLGIAPKPAQTINVDLTISGVSPVSLAARTWMSGQAQPAWQATAQDSSAQRIARSGAVGLHAYLSRSAKQAVSVGTTNFTAAKPDAIGKPALTPPPTAKPPRTTTSPPSSAGGRGSPVVGSTAYPVPSGAIFVAASGSDGNAGTSQAPKKTVQAAIAATPAGGTVVVRGGTYHESVRVPAGKSVTVQAYPKEAVWFDGAVPVSGFSGGSGRWSAPWAVQLDASPTDTRGAADYTTVNWQFVNPAHPMAAHPDQVWIASQELRQVGSLSQLVAGTFFVDSAAKRLYVGSDPSGKAVSSSELPRAFTVQADGTTIRGIGIRRYASSVPDQGVVTAHASRMTLENVIVQDSSTGGVGLFGTGHTLRHVTVSGSGQLGIQGHHADGVAIIDSLIRGSNDEQFNQMPVAGGIKFTSSRGVTLSNSEVSGGFGNGFWTDMASYDITVVNNTIASNTGRGIFLELSSKAVVAGNRISNNADGQFVARVTDRVQLWNNTIVGTARAVEFSTDSRNTSNTAYARDTRRPYPDPEMPWTIGNSTISNNILQSSGYLLDIEDNTHAKGASQIGFTANGNVFNQAKAGTPGWIIVWARAGSNPFVYGTLAPFQVAQAQEKHGVSMIGPSVVTSTFTLTAAVQAKAATVAQPLPAEVATKVGKAVGTRNLGSWGS